MSYLITPELPEFKKAVISFWFRVPKASMDQAKAELDQDPQPDPLPPFWGQIPLVVFGKEGTTRASPEAENSSEPITTSTTITNTVMTWSDSITNLGLSLVYAIAWFPDENAGGTYTQERTYYKTTISYEAKPGKPKNPSFIAVDGYGHLQVNFESTKVGDVVLPYAIIESTDKYYTQSSVNQCWTYQFLDGCEAGGDTIVGLPGFIGILQVIFGMTGYRMLTAVTDHLVDQGSSEREDHEAEQTFGPVPGDMGTGTISFVPPVELEADTWHHVLVSVDMSDGSASTGYAVGDHPSWEESMARITATSLLYVAVDDVDYKPGGNLFPDTNKVATESALHTVFLGQAARYHGNEPPTPEGPIPSYSLTEMSVPAGAVGIPAIAKYADKIRTVQMAEFMLFTDKVLDTGVEENRRIFIAAKDKNGEQLPTNFSPIYIPISKYAIGDPAYWEPGADDPAYIPALSSLDPSWVSSSHEIPPGTKPAVTADIDFTKCSFNWMMGRNLGTLQGKVETTRDIKSYWPPPPAGSDPKLEAVPGS